MRTNVFGDVTITQAIVVPMQGHRLQNTGHDGKSLSPDLRADWLFYFYHVCVIVMFNAFRTVNKGYSEITSS